MNEIESFIKRFKKRHPDELTDSFLNSNCYHFAVVLRDIFPGGHIYYDVAVGHFVYAYQGSFYDITGAVGQYAHLVSMDKLKEYDELQYNRVIEQCVRKISCNPK